MSGLGWKVVVIINELRNFLSSSLAKFLARWSLVKEQHEITSWKPFSMFTIIIIAAAAAFRLEALSSLINDAISCTLTLATARNATR